MIEENYPDDLQIAKWKDQYQNIFAIDERGYSFIFRPLSANEYDLYLSASDTATGEEIIFKSALLYPDVKNLDIDNMPGGFISALSDEILLYSVWENPKEAVSVLNMEREKETDIRFLMKTFILSTMPVYSEEQLDSLNYPQLAHKVALAESIIKLQQSSMGIDAPVKLTLIDPEEQKKKLDRETAEARAKGQAPPSDEIARKLHEALNS